MLAASARMSCHHRAVNLTNAGLLRSLAASPPRTAINSQRSLPAATKDQGAEVAADMRVSRRRARCVPDRPVNGGNSRSLADSLMRRLTCG